MCRTSSPFSAPDVTDPGSPESFEGTSGARHRRRPTLEDLTLLAQLVAVSILLGVVATSWALSVVVLVKVAVAQG
jgi:hypothetical protein